MSDSPMRQEIQMPPKLSKCVIDEDDHGNQKKRWVTEDKLTADDLESLVRPFPKKRQPMLNGGSSSASMSDCGLREEEMPHPVTQPPPQYSPVRIPTQPLPLPQQTIPTQHAPIRRTNSRARSDDMDITAPPTNNSGSRERTHTKYYKTSRGVTEKGNTHIEKQPSIEDAVYIYRALMNNGSRPPVFLQRNLVYLPNREPQPLVDSYRKHRDFELLIDRLSALASVCSQIQLSLVNIKNIRIIPSDKKDITIDLYLLKNCYKRRKTDVTSKEKFIKSIHLKTPLDLESSNRSVILDTNEIAADVGSHHMSACYLKAKVSITTERKPRPGPYNAKKPKRKAVAEPLEPKYSVKEYISSLLLYSGGKTYIPGAMQTMYLQTVTGRGAEQTVPEYMDWDEMSTKPQLVFESLQFSNRRSGRSSPAKHFPHAPSASGYTKSQYNNPHNTGGMSSPRPNPLSAAALNNGTQKLYFVLQYKGAPQTTVQNSYTCPFCLRQTRPSVLVYLLKHLRLCHSRLLFLYKETDGEPTIIVTVNAHYDGSYVGNPLDIIPILKSGSAANSSRASIMPSFKREEPTRRTPYTEVLNIRANKKALSLEEFSKPEALPLISSSALLGHNRLYYHSITNQPVLSNDFSVDSDGEDTEWQRKASGQLIEEFIDVNRGEKELMKLWNHFISKNTQYISDVQMEKACLQFVRENMEILSFKLRNNFLCHLATMYDSGVLHPRHIGMITESLQKKPTSIKGKALANGHHSSKS